MKRFIIAAFCLNAFFVASAQDVSFKKTNFTIEKGAVVNVSEIKSEWLPVLQHIEMPLPGGDKEMLEKIKQELREKYPVKSSSQSYHKTQHGSDEAAAKPLLLNNFQGNNGGVPLDNDMAISNGGKVVSVSNTVVYMYDVNTNTLLKTVTLDTFGLALGVTASKYDPKVIYDPIADRFILVYLNGFISTSTKITVAFSQTNDPTGNWNLYTITGNPFLLAQWSDYPMIAITEKDFFLTINLLKNSMPWQTGFVQTLIWQVQKDKGYNGQSLTTTMYSDIEFDGRKIRNLCPVKGGAKILGPNMYFLSNRNLMSSNDSLFLVEVTNSQESGNATLTAKLVKAPFHYFVPPAGRQAANKFLQTNDSRVLGALLHNDKIQFVQNTLDTSTGTAAIYHGIMSNITGTPTVTAHLISDTLLDFGYPNISYCGTNITHTGLSEPENECIITFSHTAPTVFAGISAVYYNNEGAYSPLLTVKEGDNYIYLSWVGNNSRWGDYSGSQRKYNEPGKVWLASTFGKSDNTYGTWIAELGTPEQAVATPTAPNAIFYPNPVNEIASVNFFLDVAEKLTFYIYDDLGRLVIKLGESNAQEGQNIFSFSTLPLRIGTYFLVVEGESKTITKEKFVKY